MSDSEEDPYGGEGGDAGYVSFGQWTRRYVNGGKQKWGRGNCFDFLERGVCFGCSYNHPQLTLRVTGAGVEARPKRLAPWCQALEALEFKYQGDDTWSHPTISPRDTVCGLLRKGVDRPHFDFVGEGFKPFKDAFEAHRIAEEMREEMAANPDAQIMYDPSSGVLVYPDGTDQATIDAVRAAVVAPAPAPAPSEDAFDDEAALELVAAAEEAEAAKTKAADDVIDWDAVGDAADAARAEHDAKRARVL
jgi:hypothetical protein